MSIMYFVFHFLSLVAFAGVSCHNKILEDGDARIQINVCHVLFSRKKQCEPTIGMMMLQKVEKPRGD